MLRNNCMQCVISPYREQAIKSRTIDWMLQSHTHTRTMSHPRTLWSDCCLCVVRFMYILRLHCFKTPFVVCTQPRRILKHKQYFLPKEILWQNCKIMPTTEGKRNSLAAVSIRGAGMQGAQKMQWYWHRGEWVKQSV